MQQATKEQEVSISTTTAQAVVRGRVLWGMRPASHANTGSVDLNMGEPLESGRHGNGPFSGNVILMSPRIDVMRLTLLRFVTL
ncbi:hypothetical protein XPA_008333 [Xanthoria parietina]